MSSKYTSRIKAKKRKKGGAMTEEGRDLYHTLKPVLGKRPARMARKAVNTVMNHGEEIFDTTMDVANVVGDVAEVAGGAMTEEGRDLYHTLRPVLGKRPARMARKAVNTAMTHGEEIIDTAMDVAGLVGDAVGEKTEDVGEVSGGGLSLQDHHDMSKYVHRSYHNYHHMHHHVGNMSPYMHRGWRAVANILGGGDTDPMFPHIKPHHFSDYEYSKHARAPKAAYKDIAKSDRYSLMDALEDEHHDHKAGKSGAGLWHAVNSVAKASAHWGRKQEHRQDTIRDAVKTHHPGALQKMDKYISHVTSGARWVHDNIEQNRHSWEETAGHFASSGLEPISAVGEMMQDHAHHIDAIHSISGDLKDLKGGALKDTARKYMRTAATTTEVSAAAAGVLGTMTAQPELLAYAALAVPAAEGLRYFSGRL